MRNENAVKIYSAMHKLSSLLLTFYDQLITQFGKQHWWPADTPWEVAVGAVLTQNTNWNNVEKAINILKANEALASERILDLDVGQLAKMIRPSGYFNLKAKRLKNLANWWYEHASSASSSAINFEELRTSLLGVNGIGEETADSILLYSFNYRTFVVDAYTKKFLLRHRLVPPSVSYSEIKILFERNLPPDTELFKEYHALIVILGKNYCRSKPVCEQCSLRWHLD